MLILLCSVYGFNSIPVKKLIPIFLFFLCISCESVGLEEDPIVKKHFSETEILHLNSILNFFDKEVEEQTPESIGIIKSYNSRFQVIKDSMQVSNPNVPILEIDSKKLKLLMSELPDSLINNIWYSFYRHDSFTNDSSKFLDIHPSSTYSEFLKSASSKSKFIAEYYDHLQQMTAISPSMHANMLLFPEKLNIQKERERLIYAIHFISLNKLPEN